MAARKLQTEIDKTLKRVSEGVELFESIHDKMQTATNQTQKEKQEADLKTQIKKLQRLRDQIKTWVQGSEIKDKSILIENRRLIETQMEKFKACEKEMKTKAFSKEGLTQAQKLDPREREKVEMQNWITTQLEELARQVEQTEAEIAGLTAVVKKKNKAGTASKVDELNRLNARRNWHVSRLEIVLRLLENGTLTTDSVGDIKDSVNYFVEVNGAEDFEEDEGIYDELNLDEEEEAFGIVGDDNGDSGDEQSMTSDAPPRTPLRDLGKGKSPSQDDDVHLSPVLKKQPVPVRKQTLDKSEPPALSIISKPPPVPSANFAAQPMSQALKTGLTPSISTVPKPVFPMRYAAAAGGSTPSAVTSTPLTSSATVASTGGSSLPPPTPASTAPSLHAASHSTPPQSPSVAPSVASPVASSIAPPSQTSRITPPVAESTGSVAGSYYHDSRAQSPANALTDAEASVASPTPQSVASVTSPIVATSTAAESTQSLNGVGKSQTQTNAPSQTSNSQVPSASTTNAPPQSFNPSLIAPPNLAPGSNPSPLPQQVQQVPIAAPFPPGIQPPRIGTPTDMQQSTTGQPPIQSQRHTPAPRTSLPGSLGDLVSSFEAVKQKAAQRMNNPDQMHKVLEVAMNGVPQPRDAEKPKYYVPRSQYNSPPYYPQSLNQFHSSPTLFGQLDVETLFYVFYFLPGTYQQFLAANELKKQSWRFHVKYLTWFQRHSEPQAITDEYEQGVYVYFDWEGSWCQRKKSDFRFEYRYLSED